MFSPRKAFCSGALRPQVDGPLHLRVHAAVVDDDAIAAFDDFDAQVDWLVHVHAVVVDPAVRLGLAVRPGCQARKKCLALAA